MDQLFALLTRRWLRMGALLGGVLLVVGAAPVRAQGLPGAEELAGAVSGVVQEALGEAGVGAQEAERGGSLGLPDLFDLLDSAPVGSVGGGSGGAGAAGVNSGPPVAAGEGERLGSALEIALLLTALSLLPGALISLTSFTRIVIVLSFVRRSMGVNELPPNPILIGLALFLTSFVMAPVVSSMVETAYVPYKAGQIEPREALDAAWGELSVFLLANTRPGELQLFQELAAGRDVAGDGAVMADASGGGVALASATSFSVLVPAFVLSELKTAFQMGFLLFLPFLVIDLVVSSVLLSMGMFMLPPITISTPFKILLFVLVDGWTLIARSLVTSFA